MDVEQNYYNDMNTLIILLLLLLYAKWLLYILMFPWVCLLFQFRKHKGFLRKVLAVPGLLLEIVTREGAARFVIIETGYIPSVQCRILLYKMLAVSVSPKAVIHYKTEIRSPHKLQLGEGAIIGDNAILDARNCLTIGNHANLSSNVSIYTEQHDYRDPQFGSTNGDVKSVTIGDRAWIGSNVIILPGVTIGEGAVCCSGCVVTKDVAPYDVVAGVPAKKINSRPQNMSYEFDGKSCWFY